MQYNRQLGQRITEVGYAVRYHLFQGVFRTQKSAENKCDGMEKCIVRFSGLHGSDVSSGGLMNCDAV
jgi:hypothetical protein